MAQKRRFLDVWIVESNTVYREVPYTVVVDWVQQGRLLEEDRLRPSGTEKWYRLGGMSAFAAYLPRAEPHRAEDQAEALEPVQLDFGWKRRRDDEEDDVDMIPLIDISLVLLIFFIMTTAAGAAAAALINTPFANYPGVISNANMLWVGIDKAANDQPVYSLGQGDGQEAANLTKAELLQHLDALLARTDGPVEVRIRAHRSLPIEVVREMTVELGKRRTVTQDGKPQPKVVRMFAEVSKRENP
jgi:biopolymer transport protein ExbD